MECYTDMKTKLTALMCMKLNKNKRKGFTMVEILMVSVIDLVAIGFMVALVLHINNDYSRALGSQIEIRNTGKFVVELQDEIYRADSLVCTGDKLRVIAGEHENVYGTTIARENWSKKNVTYNENSRNIFVNIGGTQYVFTKR